MNDARNMRRPHPAVALRAVALRADAQRRTLAGLRVLGLTPVDRGKIELLEPPAFDLARYTR